MIKKNNAQEKAIQTISGQLILVACPGAGKTTTLLRRIKNAMIATKIIILFFFFILILPFLVLRLF